VPTLVGAVLAVVIGPEREVGMPGATR
jgi:hypothetical protein